MATKFILKLLSAVKSQLEWNLFSLLCMTKEAQGGMGGGGGGYTISMHVGKRASRSNPNER